MYFHISIPISPSGHEKLVATPLQNCGHTGTDKFNLVETETQREVSCQGDVTINKKWT